jgi:hypothetical protein
MGEHLPVLGVVALARSSASSNRPLRLNAVASRSLISSSNSGASVRSAMSSAAWSTVIASPSAPRRSATRPSATITPSWVTRCRLDAESARSSQMRRASAKHSAAFGVVGEAHVRLGEVGEQVADDVGAVLAGELHGPPAEAHRRQVLRARRADAGDVAEDEGGEPVPPERLVDGERGLVGDDGPVVVAHRVVDRGDRC